MFDSFFYFFTATATTEIYTLSLHDALPISVQSAGRPIFSYFSTNTSAAKRRDLSANDLSTPAPAIHRYRVTTIVAMLDRKSTRLNSSHSQISYAVFCLKKKKRKFNIHASHR